MAANGFSESSPACAGMTMAEWVSQQPAFSVCAIPAREGIAQASVRNRFTFLPDGITISAQR
ncbi:MULTISPECIES: hypothetical protein [unclassified Brenneria]|uniref:hypothetical protein n=1 Tax=unclassified Brenneria TaxID=2634434 RepID=UPI0029C29539|nr:MULTISPECIES: hypothetical protein [unclassified Brenneria]MDX5626588.1 hypothetical protein [Brenneria sp. L3-3Z]MDX5694062.1 hypothetical protein [Brenneria sp. L4-2C]